MDAKITKQRISRMLSYDWLKIIGLALAVIFFWSIIFKMTSTRMLPSQEFTIFNYYCNAPISDAYYTRQDGLVKNNVFSQEVMEVHTYDLALQPDMYQTLLQTRFSTNEGDLFFVPNETNQDVYVMDGTEKKYPLTHVETLLSGYPFQFFDIEEYLDGMSTWLDGWYEGGHQSGTLNEDKIKEDFIAYVTKNKDKRYKTKKEKETGATKEVERVLKYKTAYDVVTGAIADGTVKLERVQTKNSDGSLLLDNKTDKPLCDGAYALNLCPNDPTAKMQSWYQYNSSTDKDKPTISAKNMCVMFLDMYAVADAYEYESLVYVAYMINDCYSTNA